MGQKSLSAAEWESLLMRAVYSGSAQCGNHVCMARVCYKGRWAKLRFCRMLYWHWKRCLNKHGKEVMRRAHGLLLQKPWDGTGLPPVQVTPPNPGVPLLEMNFPFFFKLMPSILLGPSCNHDLGVLLRFPVLSPLQLAAALGQPHPRGSASAAAQRVGCDGV